MQILTFHSFSVRKQIFPSNIRNNNHAQCFHGVHKSVVFVGIPRLLVCFLGCGQVSWVPQKSFRGASGELHENFRGFRKTSGASGGRAGRAFFIKVWLSTKIINKTKRKSAKQCKSCKTRNSFKTKRLPMISINSIRSEQKH